MKLQISTTFDFGKLERKMKEIMNDVVDDGKRLYRTTTRENLKEGNLRKLRPASIEARKRGHYWGGKKVAPTDTTKPLVYTGDLLNSIKWKEDGVEMNEYGLFHQKGFLMRTGTLVKPRPFFALKPEGKRVKGTKYGKEYDKFINKMYKRIGKALKK